MAAKQIPLTFLERSKPYLCIVLGIGSFSAAKWQQMRKEKKVEYLSLMEQRLSAKKIECPNSLTNAQINDQYKFTKVSVSGEMDTHNSIIVSPRKPPYSAKIKNINVNDPNELGGYIYSPVITKSGEMVVVNRGWIPKEQLPSNVGRKNENEIIEETEKESMISVCFEGLITPLKNIPKFVKEAANCDVNDTVWPFLDSELLRQRFDRQNETESNDKEFIVIDAMKPQNKMGTFPHRVQQNDLIMVSIPPIQHSVYVWMMCCTGIACFYYSYYFFKNPRSVKKLNSLMYKRKFNQLNTARTKVKPSSKQSTKAE